MDGGYGGADGEAKADAVALSVGYKDCEQAFARWVFDHGAYSGVRFHGVGALLCKTLHGKSFYASTIRGTILGGVTYDLSTIR